MSDELLITLTAASKIHGAPSRQMLYKLVNRNPPADFVVFDEKGRPKINANHPSWKNYIEPKFKRELQRDRNVPKEKRKPPVAPAVRRPSQPAVKESKPAPPVQTPEEKKAADLFYKAKEAEYRKMIADAETAEYKAKTAKMQFQETTKNTVHTDFARFAFYGYWKRINVEMMGMRNRVESRVKNMASANEWKGILDLLDAEHEEIMREVKTAHKKDLAEFELTAEMGRS